MSQQHQRCIFCYKLSTPFAKDGKTFASVQDRFLHLTERYFRLTRQGISSHSRLFSHLSSQLYLENTTCCVDCFTLTKSFCNIFEEWSCLQLRMDLLIDRLRNVMRLADRILSRVKEFRAGFADDEDMLERVKKKRNKFKQMCRLNRTAGYPRVLLQTPQMAVKKVEYLEEHHEVQYAEQLPLDTSAENSYLLGWIFSLCAIASLSLSEGNGTFDGDIQDYLSVDGCDERDILSPAPSFSGSSSSSHISNGDVFDKVSLGSISTAETMEDSDCWNKLECMPSTSVLHSDENRESGEISNSIQVIVTDTDCKRFSFDLKQGEFATLSRTGKGTIFEDDKCMDSENSPLNTTLKEEKNEDSKLDTHSYKSGMETSETSGSECGNVNDDTTLVGVTKYTHRRSRLKTNRRRIRTKKVTNQQGQMHPPQKLVKCTKCNVDLNFGVRAQRAHQHYFHSNGYAKLGKSEITILNLSWTNLKLKGVNLLEQFHCIEDESCGKMFVLETDIQNHQQLHKRFNCMTCDDNTGKQLPSLELISHELDHSNQKQQMLNTEFAPGEQFFCSRCTFSTLTQGQFVNHYLSEHLNLPPIQSVCPICKMTFPCSDQAPLQHYVNYHDLTRLEGASHEVTCKQESCTAYFLTEDQLLKHCSSVHAMYGSFTDVNRIEENVKKLVRKRHLKKLSRRYKAHGGKFQCSRCPRAYGGPGPLRVHEWRMHSSDQNRRGPIRDIVITPDGLTVRDIAQGRDQYRCEVEGCHLAFVGQNELGKHSKLHGKFSCNFCQVTKTFAMELPIHELSHHPDTIDSSIYNCSRCNFQNQNEILYIEHHIKEHLNLSMDKRTCSICQHCYGNTRTAVSTLEKNVLKHHVEDHDLDGVDSPQNCDKCPAYFRTQLGLFRHQREIHGMTTSEERHKCQDCGLQYASPYGLRHHRIHVHKLNVEEWQFVCEFSECGRRFEKKMDLEYHMRHVHARGSATFTCDQCEKLCIGRSALAKHLESHELQKKEKIRKYCCEKCGRSFTTSGRYWEHKKRHLGVDNWGFSCVVCSKKCYSKDKLDEHVRTHTGEKPFICDHCGAEYGHRHNWRNHVNKNHGLKESSKKYDRTNSASTRKGKKLKG